MFVKKFKILAIYKQHHLKLTLVRQGLWGLKAIKSGVITGVQLESARKVIARLTDKMCKVWIKLRCSFSKTKKALGSRMGKGVGSFFKFILNVTRGTILLEVFGSLLVTSALVRKSLLIASKKLSVRSILCKKVIYLT